MLAKGAGLVPGLRLRSVCRLPRDVRVPLAEAKKSNPAPRQAPDCAASKVGCGACVTNAPWEYDGAALYER